MIPTNEQIASLSGKDLVDAYNKLATAAQRTHVSRFATRSDGVRRTTNLAEAVREQAVVADAAPVSFSQPSFYSDEAAAAAHNPTDAILEEAATPVSNVVQLPPRTQVVKRAKEKTTVTALKSTAQRKPRADSGELHERIAKQAGRGDRGLKPNTLADACRAAILEGLDDEAVIARLRETFTNVPGNAARHYRKVMTVRGIK
jgi:hypothetical protein